MNSDLIITQCIAPSSCLISNLYIVSTCASISLAAPDLLPIGNSVEPKHYRETSLDQKIVVEKPRKKKMQEMVTNNKKYLKQFCNFFVIEIW